MRSKEIIFVLGNYKNGGMARRATNIAYEFGKKGHSVIILVTGKNDENSFFEPKENVKLEVLSEYLAGNTDSDASRKIGKNANGKISVLKKLHRISKPIPILSARINEEIHGIRRSINFKKYLINHKGATVIGFGLSYYIDAYYAVKGLNCKLVCAEKNASALEAGSSDKKYLEKIIGKADAAVFQTYDEMSFYGDSVEKNGVVIRNPIKKELPEPFTGTRRKTVVNFCRINEQKNLPLLIDAFKLLLNDYPDYTLEIYGNTVEVREEELKQSLVDEVKASGLSDKIKILPPRNDIHYAVLDCAMFVSSSDYEGLSNSMIEAMAIGLPTICTDCLGGGAREMITDGKNGLLVPMKNAEALYRAMKRIVEEPILADKLSENGSKLRKELDAEKIATQWICAIEEK